MTSSRASSALLKAPLIALATLSLVGCTLPGTTVDDLRYIAVETGHSQNVSVSKVWLEREKGGVVAKGYVLKVPEAKDTTGTHLDLVVYDEDGIALRSLVAHFEPRQIPRRYRMPDYASFSVTLGVLPKGTARISVRAHEGNHL